MTARLWMLLGILAALGLALWRVSLPPRAPIPAEITPAVVTGETLVAKYNCTFCHVTEETRRAHVDDPVRNCAQCHIQPTHGPNENLQIVRYLAPNFDRLGNHLRPEWIAAFLRDPTHVRPFFKEEMPAFRFEDGEVDLLVEHLRRRARKPANIAPRPAPVRDSARHAEFIERGRALLREQMCMQCHLYTGFMPPEIDSVNPENLLTNPAYFAPDLRFARERLKPELLASLIRHPREFEPLGFMTKSYGLSEADADTLAYVILFADLAPLERKPLETIAVVEHPTWEADIQPLLKRYCEACHYHENTEAMGWGTGFTGGFGFPGKHFSVRDWEHFAKGSSLDGKHFTPVFAPGDMQSQLLARLRGDLYPAMPLGQKMPMEVARIFENWIRDGAKGPEK